MSSFVYDVYNNPMSDLSVSSSLQNKNTKYEIFSSIAAAWLIFKELAGVPQW